MKNTIGLLMLKLSMKRMRKFIISMMVFVTLHIQYLILLIDKIYKQNKRLLHYK